MWTCGSEAPLGFDGGEVLHVVAEVAAQVLDEPVEQRGEGQRVPGGPVIVIGGRVGRCCRPGRPARSDGQVSVTNIDGPEGLAVRRGVGLADRPGVDLAAGQVRGILAAPGGAVPPFRPVRVHLAADARLGDLLIELGDERVIVGGVGSGRRRGVALLLGFGAQHDPPLLVLGGGVGGDVGFVLEVPALPALRGAQRPSPLRTRGAHRGQGVPAGDEHLVHLPGVEVGAAQLHRADARAVLDGQVPDDLAGQRHGHPLRPRGLGGRVRSLVTSVRRRRRSRCRPSRTGGTQPGWRTRHRA